MDLDLPYDHWYEWYSDASDSALGWTAHGGMAREVCPPWFIDKPIFYKELWAVFMFVTQAPWFLSTPTIWEFIPYEKCELVERLSGI